MIVIAEPPPAKTLVAPAGLDRAAELEKSISASRLNLWLSCKLKFYFRYILQLPKPPSPSMHAGSTVHTVLQQWNLARWRKEPFSVERFKALYGMHWGALQEGIQINWDGEEQIERDSAWRALEHYFTETPIKVDEKPEAVEVGVEADLSLHGLPNLVGVIDLVRNGGRIVDFKAVGKSPDPEQVAHLHEVQLSAYSLLYQDATGRRESGLELHHLVKTKAPKLVVTLVPAATEAQHTRLFRQIESYQEGVARKDFVPSPGFHCAGCEFFLECRRFTDWKEAHA